MSGDLRDRADVEAVLLRYATALDTRDWDLLRSVFVADGVADYGDLGGGVHHGVEAITAVVDRALEPFSATQHLITNVVVELDGDEAAATCYLQAHHVAHPPDGTTRFVVGGIYRDRLRRTADGWRIVHRELRPVWTEQV
jgi:3-phenylpropionate/cinnamic acid dioxygenase small subunit